MVDFNLDAVGAAVGITSDAGLGISVSSGRSRYTHSSSISDMISTISSYGNVARQNKFYVMFNLPRGFISDGIPTVNDGANSYFLSRRGGSTQVYWSCEIAEIPGRSISTSERRIYGPPKHIGYGYTFAPVTMTFRVHNNMTERRFFESWQETITSTYTNDANYFDEYKSDIVIHQLGNPTEFQEDTGIMSGIGASLSADASGLSGNLNVSGARIARLLGFANNGFKNFKGTSSGDESIAAYTLLDAIPQVIAPLALDHGASDSYHRLTVTFAYRKWTTTLMQGPLTDVTIGNTGNLTARMKLPRMNTNFNTSFGI